MDFDRSPIHSKENAGIAARFFLPRTSNAKVQSGKTPHRAMSDRADAFQLDVALDLPGTGVTGIFGPSGSGKTTLLRCFAGLENPTDSLLQVNGVTWQNAETFLPPHRRPVGFVFQQPSLFAHLSVEGNLDFAHRRASPKPRQADVKHIVELTDIGHLLKRQPHNLSGGEQQRVAIARALLVKPRLLLMDEPLASLDMARKQEILPFLEAITGELALPILYVSHAVDEIARLTDHLVVLENGIVARTGSTPELMSRPDFPAPSANDIGVLLQARISARDSQWHLAQASFPGGDIWIRDGGDAIGSAIRLRIQARDVSLTRTAAADTSILNRLKVRIREVTTDRDPAMAMVDLTTMSDGTTTGTTNDTSILARITRRSLHQLALQPGDELWAQIKSVAIVR